MVASILVDTIESLALEWPTVSDDERVANAAARRELEGEDDGDAARPPTHAVEV
jgi:hypothetical protein